MWLKVENTDLYSFVRPHNMPGRLEDMSDDSSERQNQLENQARPSNNQGSVVALTSRIVTTIFYVVLATHVSLQL